jgi:dTDP-4-amino-4,6-dideoxygalactose transaminase
MSPPILGVWPSLPLDVYLRGTSGHHPFPLGQRDFRLYSRARHALWSGCGTIGLRAGDEVLAPAYHHGSEIEAMLKAGLRIRFFDVTETLEPDPAVLERILRPSVRVLYLIHYLGFPQDIVRWRSWCDERGLLLFEDAAQSWLATRDGVPVGSLGDLAIFCLYKTIGVPDGAALISRDPPDGPRSRRKAGLYDLIRRHGAWLAQRGGPSAALLAQISNMLEAVVNRGSPRTDEFTLGNPNDPPSWATEWLLTRVLSARIVDRRRDNYGFLLDALSGAVPSPFSSLANGACPFAFPIEAKDAGRVAASLERLGVKALLLWKNPHPSLTESDFPVAEALRRSIVALPVHQELGSAHLRRMADCVHAVLE